MADITNPQAIKFCNERLRPACDAFISAVRTLREAVAEYNAGQIGSLVAANQTVSDSYVADGSAVDGRPLIKGYDVDVANLAMTAILSYLDSTGASYVSQLTKPAVNTAPRF